MARFKEHEKALILRKEGKSYSQIKKILKISKSTLSDWLKNYPLTEERIRELQKNETVIEKIRNTKRKKKEKRLKEIYKIQKKLIFPLTKRETFLAGLFLYLGEGSKRQFAMLSISNTDPSIIKFFICWLTKNLDVPIKKIKIQLQLYSDMNISKEIKFWSNILKIPLNQFARPYIKKTSSKNINHKGGFGHGTFNARIGDARLSEKILMGLKSISDYYLRKIYN